MSQRAAPGSVRKWLRRLRTLLWTALSLVIVLAAVLVGIGKLLMPYSAQYKPQLEAWLSKEFNQPVQVESFTGEWKAFGPRITLEGMNLLGEPGGEGQIALQRAALDIKPLNALLAGRPLYSFRIIGADLVLVRTEDGRFELSGLGVSGRGGDGSGLGNLARVGEVRLDDSSLSFSDEARGISLQLTRLGGRLQLAGRRLALEVRASVSDEQRNRVLGDLGATVLLQLDDERRLESAEWHLDTGEVMLSELVARLPRRDIGAISGWLNAQLWGAWSRGEPQRMEGVLDIRDASLDDEGALLSLDRLNTRFRWRFSDRRTWRLDLADVRVEEGGRDWNSPRLSVERNLAGNLGVWVSADYLRVGFPLALTQRLMRTFNARWPGNVPTDGRGVIRDFDILIDADKQFAGTRARFEDLEVLEWGRWPALGRVDGSADLLLGQGNGRITGEEVRFEWPRNFRAPLVADVSGCELEVLWSGRDWQVDVTRCPLSNEFISLDGRARFRRSEGKPVVAIDAAAERADLAAIAPYLPASAMKPRVIDWLGRALAAGEATDVRFSLHGDMDDFPFRERQGSLEARFDFAGATIDYQPGWPAARQASGKAIFRDAGLRLEGRIGDLAGAPVNRVTASIDDFQQARLQLDYDTSARLPELANFIKASPLLEDSELSLERFRFEGPAEVRGDLDVPLGGTPGELAVSGEIVLDGNDFEELRSGTRLESLAGRLAFDRDGFSGEGLAALYAGFPGRLDLGAEWAADVPFRARLAGRFPASLLVAVSPLVNDPLLARAAGESDWVAELTVNRPRQEGEAAEIWLDLASDLEGVSIGLPPPLDKGPDEAWPLEVHYPVQSAEPVVIARLDQRLELRAERAAAEAEAQAPPLPEMRSEEPAEPTAAGERNETAIRRLSIQLGPGEAEMPPPGFFALHGSAAAVDMDRWMGELTAYFSEERDRGRLALSEVEFFTGRLTLMNRVFDDTRVDIDYRDGVLQTYLEAPAIAGRIRYQRAEGVAHSLHAEMQRLHLPRVPAGESTNTLNPTELPELHLFIDDLRYGDMDLGETRVEAFPVADGLRFDSVESTTDFMNFQARGEWLTGAEGDRSDFDIVMTSESLGSLVEALDLSSVLRGGQTMVRYNAWWPGSPAAFGLARLNGEMTFSVVDGKILNADAGAGRLLGLISVTALPRRLALDFRDVFASGFSFDQASGTLRLESGTAYTNDFVLESTAATLAIEGSSDLVNQAFDYRLSVRPGVSQALPVIGAIAGGPAGAAAGLALQGLLRDALGEAAEARYSIRGSWTEPEVTRIEVPPSLPTPAAETADAGPPPAEERNDE